MWSGEIDGKTADIQARSFMARTLDQNGKKCQAEGEAKVVSMVILWQDFYGKGNLRKSYYNTVGRKVPIGNVDSYTVKKGCPYLFMWMT